MNRTLFKALPDCYYYYNYFIYCCVSYGPAANKDGFYIKGVCFTEKFLHLAVVFLDFFCTEKNRRVNIVRKERFVYIVHTFCQQLRQKQLINTGI